MLVKQLSYFSKYIANFSPRNGTHIDPNRHSSHHPLLSDKDIRGISALS